MDELLSPAQMNNADRLTIAGGVAGIELMEAAGRAVCDVLSGEFNNARKILVVCGIGNNGGDGLVAARILAGAGAEAEIDVDVFFTGEESRIGGDAAIARDRIGPGASIIGEVELCCYDLIVDAIFGAGLDRDVRGKIATLITAINDCRVPVLSVDLPSGIDGASGAQLGVAIKADVTVTFFRNKPGHFLLPGRENCGRLFVRQIGIRDGVLEKTGICATLNRPQLWLPALPGFAVSGHKYSRGHTLVVSGPLAMSGASRLVGGAALRAGSGLVTIAGSKDVTAANASQLNSIMLKEAENPDDLTAILSDERINCVVLGPGMSPDQSTRDTVLAVLQAERHTVLDAGALSAFGKDRDELFSAIKANSKATVLTPHEGEYWRLFGSEKAIQSKIERAIAAAKISDATVVLKGPDTIIATPDGIATVADNAPPWLATAGSGDVLAGIIAGLLAQGMPVYEAAACAVWVHGDAANRLGPPLVSSDLDQGLRQSLSELMQIG